MPINEGPSCRHGRPECECLDLLPDVKVIDFHVTPEKGIDFDAFFKDCATLDVSAQNTNTIVYSTTTSSLPNTGTSLPNTGHWMPATITQPNPLTSSPPTFSRPLSSCESIGHVIPNDRSAICTDDEGVVCGICSVCMQSVRFPGGMKAFDFERAGIMLGRAIGVDTEDTEKVGEIMADLAALESEIDSQVRRFEAAKELLELGRGSVQMRMRRDAASGVDAL